MLSCFAVSLIEASALYVISSLIFSSEEVTVNSSGIFMLTLALSILAYTLSANTLNDAEKAIATARINTAVSLIFLFIDYQSFADTLIML